MSKIKFTEAISFVGTTPAPFEDEKKYISTGAVDKFSIDEKEIEMITYGKRPSRANLAVRTGDIIFAKMAETLKTLYIDDELSKNIYSTGFCAVRANESVLTPQCLYYLVSSPAFLLQKDKHASGATQRAITNNGMTNIIVNIPPLKDQKDCVRKLDAISLLIAYRKKQLVQFDKLVKSQFIEMFGNIGEDTKGWGLVALDECCELNPKKSREVRLKAGIEVSFIPMPAVSEDGVIDCSVVKQYEQVQTGFTYFAENDVLFAKITPCMENGKGAIARGLKNGLGFGSTEFHVLRPLNGVCNPAWLYALTTFTKFRHDAAKKMTGSAGQRRVPASFLATYKVSVPPIELQNKFASFVEQTDKSKFRIKQSLEKLEICYKALLQKYFG